MENAERVTRPIGCACCMDLVANRVDRRRLMQIAAGGLVLAAWPAAAAAQGKYEAMVLACIDPRFVEPIHNLARRRGLTGKYSQFAIAGAAIGVVHPAFKDWHKAFWDNLATSVQLHHIKRVIAIDHRDCGAAKIAYGEAKLANRAAETATHREALAQFRQEVGQRQGNLAVETGLMALDGRVEMFT
jgi:carbonic anhydrase